MYENLLALGIVIAVAELFSIGAKKIKLPSVVGQILAGLLIGPCLLGWVSGDNQYIQLFAEVGVILLMFSAGLETDLKTLKKTGPVACLIATLGVFVPLVIGTLISYLYFGKTPWGSETFYRYLFIGTIMTATSVSITVQTLKELGKISTELGTTIVSAAIIDDVIGIVVLTVVLGLAGDSDTSVGLIILKTIAFFALSVGLGFLLFKLFELWDAKFRHHRRIVIISIAFCFFMSYAAEKFFGVADITGAYVAGVILCSSQDSEYVNRRVGIGSYLFFGPVFFASIGLKTDITGMSWALLGFCGLFVAGALLSKIIGCGFAAKVTGHTWKESLIAGVGMMTRGEVALVVAQKGLAAGLFDSQYFTAVILLIIFSSVLTPILLKVLFSEPRKAKAVV